MSAFHDVRLPLALALGASGGPERRCEIVALGSGRETRNSPWTGSRRRYDVASAVRTTNDLHVLLSFFEARRGRLHAFRFRDMLDCKSCPPSDAVSATDQVIGVGDGVRTAFQLTKTYADAAGAWTRVISKPLPGVVVAALDGQTTQAFSVSTLTGIIEFAAAPVEGVVVSAGFEFDVPVRFDSDRLEVSLDAHGAGRVASVSLIEVLE